MKKSLYALSLSLSLMACQPGVNQAPELRSAQSLKVNSTTSTLAPRKNYPAIEKHPANGQIKINGQQLTLSLELYPKTEAGFKTQLLDLSPATKLQATVSDSHGKTYTAVGADADGINYTGGLISLTFNNVTPNTKPAS